MTSNGTGRISVLLIACDEAGQRLEVSNPTFRELVYRRRLPSVRIGRQRLIAPGDGEIVLARLRDEGRELSVPPTTWPEAGAGGRPEWGGPTVIDFGRARCQRRTRAAAER